MVSFAEPPALPQADRLPANCCNLGSTVNNIIWLEPYGFANLSAKWRNSVKHNGASFVLPGVYGSTSFTVPQRNGIQPSRPHNYANLASTLTMSSTARLSVALAVLIVADVAAQATVTSIQSISPPTARPSNAFEVPPDFLGVGFESAYLPSYNNDFSENLVDSLASRIAAPPTIRVGGTSGDLVTFNPNQKAATRCAAGDCAGDSDKAFILGPSYFDTFKRFQSARFSFQAPLTNHVNATNVIAYVQHAYDAVGPSRVDAIALGNEVNFYEHSAAEFWTRRPGAGNPYTVEGVFDEGINRDGLVKYVAEHYYQYKGNISGITEQLLNHTALKVKFDTYSDAIHYTLSRPNTKFIFSETGGPLEIIQNEQFYFANTLWSVNFRLYAMTRGVSRVAGTQRPETLRSLWIPESGWKPGVGPRVQAPYYALPYVADFIGKTVSGDRGVINLDLGNEVISGYAMFEGGSLARIAIVNLRRYDGKGIRNAVQVHLHNLGSVSQVKVRRLHADAGTAAGGFDVDRNNITYAGQQWSYEVDQGKGHGREAVETQPVTDGVVNIVVPDTEALIISMK
ncbi:F-box only protein 21 [Mycena venus]|uniref:F-box only protein 21 n=1 Tax=Mycena venus TaxID=2733690 RepID=A0A8H6TU31_9AGAR|nr:F-box only protein 21 [Mycena venus]